jgi:hypothetical protein
LGSILIVGWRGVGERIDQALGSTGRRFVDAGGFVSAGGELVFSSLSSIGITA